MYVQLVMEQMLQLQLLIWTIILEVITDGSISTNNESWENFFWLDNVNFGYNFFNNVTKSTRVKMRAGVTLQNYLVITNYTGLDPEVAGGIDNNLYPRPRVTLLNLNITF